MVKKKQVGARKKKDITLRDVVVHMNHLHQDLSVTINDVAEQTAQNTIAIHKLDKKIDGVEIRLTKRMDSLQEDLEATIRDTVKIRKHVGMPVSEEF
ncbi:hypothetical protein HYZ99_02360 [Candidatus Peregrinibacteria bacterium]|nr:hypothetical protein [Candidatus Peregrinibacteria bacterium]